jgi:alpha-galactosidase
VAREQEQRSNFALWAILKSPLMVGTDLRALSQVALDMLTAPEVLAVNQDKLGAAGDLVWKEGPLEVRRDGCHARQLWVAAADMSRS